VIVFAGPGTGKTYRIETELLRLLLEEQVPPEQILVTTFTNKAADELRVRIRARLQGAGRTDADQLMQPLRISTIHAFCYALIGEFHHHILFLKGTFAPMSEAQRLLFLFRHGPGELRLKDLYPEWKGTRRTAGGWCPADLFHFYADVGAIYDFLSEEVMSGADERLRIRYLEIIHQEGVSKVEERIIATYPNYWRLVQAEGYLDYSMVLAYAEALLDDPQVRRRVQARYRHLLVDEYQDTNPIQDRIFRAIAGADGRMFAVGDDDQSIYAFRGADVRNAVDFVRRWPGARVESLDVNRRSTRAIVEATQALIRHNRTRQPKDLRTDNPVGDPPWCVSAPKADLPQVLAGLLARLKGQGTIERWSDVGLLFRGMTDRVVDYHAALTGAGVPATVVGDRHFLRRPVISGLMGVLEMVEGPAEQITSRKRKHRDFFGALGWSDRDRMLEAVRGWHSRLHGGEYGTLLDLYYGILNDTQAIRVSGIMPDLGWFSSFLAETEPQIRSPELIKRLHWFLQYAGAAADALDGPPARPEEAVQVMTMHKSKGLEFPVVVVPDVFEEFIPADFPEDVRTRLRRLLAGTEPWLDVLEEERRVLYVAMTRAERLVVLLTASDAAPSRFLKEFSPRMVPAEALGATAAAAPWRRHARREEPLHATHSQIYNYQFCPLRYLLENCYGFAGQAIAPLRAGQSLHRALEIFHRLMRDGAAIPADRLQGIFDCAWVQPRETRKAAQEREKLFAVFRTYADRHAAERDTVRVLDVERPFFVTERAGILTGKMDLLRERSGALEIVEFKFHRNPMLPDYPRRQLDHYSLACAADLPTLVVHYLEEDRQEIFPRRPPEAVRSELAETFCQMRDGRFAARPHPRQCRLCPVRFACAERAAAVGVSPDSSAGC